MARLYKNRIVFFILFHVFCYICILEGIPLRGNSYHLYGCHNVTALQLNNRTTNNA